MTVYHIPAPRMRPIAPQRRAVPAAGMDPTFVQGLGDLPLPPPANSALATRFADAFQFDQGVAARQPTQESKLTDALMRMVRTTTITAAPPAHIRPTPFSDALDLSA